jgi:type IV pilus biogenesis protein CpaD/CtpE
MASSRLNPSLRPLMSQALLLSALLACCIARPAHADPACPQDQPAGRPLSRAEVQADLAVWRQSGADRFTMDGRGQSDPDYEEAYARYLSLRRGPAYQAALARFTGAQARDQPAQDHAGVAVGTSLR